MSRIFAGLTSGDELRAASQPYSDPLPSQFAMDCWFYPTVDQVQSLVGSWETGAGDDDFARIVLLGSGGVQANIRQTVPNTDAWGPTNTYSTDTWHHVILARNSSDLAVIVLDGDWANRGELTSTFDPVGLNVLCFGKWEYSNVQGLDGRFGMATLWEGVNFVQEEVEALARGVHPYRVKPDGIVGHWRPGSGSPEPDYSGQGNNLTVTGVTIGDSAPVAPMFFNRGYNEAFFTEVATTHRLDLLGASILPLDSNCRIIPYSLVNSGTTQDQNVLVMDNGAVSRINGVFRVPENFVSEPRLTITWTSETTAGDVLFKFRHRTTDGSDSELLDISTSPTELEHTRQLVRGPSAASEQMQTVIRLSATDLTAGSLCYFEFERDGSVDDKAAAITVWGLHFDYAD